MRWLALPAGIALLVITLTDMFRTMVMPRAVRGRFRLTRILFLVVSGLGAGAFVTYVVARSLSDGLDPIRAALAQVQAGDLDTEIQVDDGGEVGQLQNGFNRMVAGLRERRQLQDLFGRHVEIGL